MKTGEVAARIGVARQTVRNWKDEFAEYLSPHLSKSGKGTVLIYNDHDVRVLATIAHCKDQRFTPDEIRHVLDDDDNLVDIPPLPSKEEAAARQRVKLVPLSEVQRAITTLETERDRIIAEREAERKEYQQQLAEANQQIQQLSEQVGLLTGELKQRRESEQKTDELQAEIVKLNREVARLELLLEMTEKD
jgi:DNA-binding transcriptional MerR regulator